MMHDACSVTSVGASSSAVNNTASLRPCLHPVSNKVTNQKKNILFFCILDSSVAALS